MRRASFRLNRHNYAGGVIMPRFLPSSVFELQAANLYMPYVTLRNSCEHC